ncbi:MAG: YkgJ family cysteine cluster protein [Campylobacterota bacterium]|nr:YkgJ family cysteine cluster protein [Campylobacterota bacterium]
MFPCTSCGLCCQNIADVKELKDFDLGNGVCRHFNSISNSCNIYDDRPDICKVDKMFEIKYHRFFTKKDFYIENAKVCNELQNQYKLNDSYKVKIGE